MISRPGCYYCTEDEYHADPVVCPSLSSGIARTLLNASPRHAWHAHPRLNPDFVPQDSETFDLGRAAHAYILEGRDGFAIIDAPDWRTKAAREARDAARADGRTPVLASKWAAIQQMGEAVKAQCESLQAFPILFAEGTPEQTIVWQEGEGVWCRARLDWLHPDNRTIDDLKTTAASAEPGAWTRTLFNSGYDFQAAFYLRGLKAVTGADGVFRFVVVENYPPFACSLIELGPDVLALARQKVQHAIDLWARCITMGEWPGYPTRPCFAELPAWEEARWLEREAREEAA